MSYSDYLWTNFEKTGDVSWYLFYRILDNNNYEGSLKTGAPAK